MIWKHHPALHSLINQDVVLQVSSVQCLIGHEFEEKCLYQKAKVFSKNCGTALNSIYNRFTVDLSLEVSA